MSRKRTRRRVYPLVDPVGLALGRVATLTGAQRADLLAPARAALELLAIGRGTREAWQALADAFNIGEALAELGIAPDHLATIQAAQVALGALVERIAARGWTLYPTELCMLRDGLFIVGVQHDYCSAGELTRAVEIVRNRIRAALAGNAGPRTTVHAPPSP